MLENPGDELYFGEVYRQVLQEAWLPEGADVWSRLGKSRRGRRPTQSGLVPRSPTEEQAAIRECFSKCAAAWRELPWELPPSPFCDNRNDKKFFKKEKDDRGVMCSYYDLYMKYCLRFCLDTGCIPPANYLLIVEPELKEIGCNKVYDLNFGNNCGDVSMISGPGEFVAPSEWVSPKCGTEGQLCFEDENGSKGSTTYQFSEEYWCTEFGWPGTNPVEIGINDSKKIYIEGGIPPFTWSIKDTDMHLSMHLTENRFNFLISGPDACGTATIDVIDICGNEVQGKIRCVVGSWHFMGNTCGLGGTATCITPCPFPSSVNEVTLEKVSGNRRQLHLIRGYSHGCVDQPGPCNSGTFNYACGSQSDDGPCANCLQAFNPPTPAIPGMCSCYEEFVGDYDYCFCTTKLFYYEWDC